MTTLVALDDNCPFGSLQQVPRARAIDVDGHWQEQLPETVPEYQAPRPSVVCGHNLGREDAVSIVNEISMAGFYIQEFAHVTATPSLACVQWFRSTGLRHRRKMRKD